MIISLLSLLACESKEMIMIEGMNPGECTDRADNDSDGWFDCEDADCEASPDCIGMTPSDTNTPIDTSVPVDSGEDPNTLETNCTAMMTNSVTGSVGGQDYVLNDAIWDSNNGNIVMMMFEAIAEDPLNCTRITEGSEPLPPVLMIRGLVENIPETVSFQTDLSDQTLGVAVFTNDGSEMVATGGSVTFDRLGPSENGVILDLSAVGLGDPDSSLSADTVTACYCPGVFELATEPQEDTGEPQ
jgi:hypothetical protein